MCEGGAGPQVLPLVGPFRPVRVASRPQPIDRALFVPLGQPPRPPLGLMVVGVEEPLADHEGAFLEFVATQLTNSLLQGRTFEAERQRLQASERRFRTVVGQAATGVVQTDAAGRMTLVNQRWCEMLGYSEGELLAMNIADVTDPENLAPTLAAVRRLAEGGPDFVIEKRYRRKDGSRLWASSSVSALRGPEGEYLGLVAVVVDITEQKRTELLLNEHAQLLERIAVGSPLDACLTAVTGAISRLEPRTRACVLLADAARRAFTDAFAAEIPSSFGSGLKGAPIDDLAIGTCGEAVFRGQPVTCPDIAADERWSRTWRDLCVAHGIVACHSEPVLGTAGRPLASLMLCFDRPRAPTPWERRLAGFGAHV